MHVIDQEIQEFTPMLWLGGTLIKYSMTGCWVNFVCGKEGNLCDYVSRRQWVVLLLLTTGSSLLCTMHIYHLRERALPAPPLLGVATWHALASEVNWLDWGHRWAEGFGGILSFLQVPCFSPIVLRNACPERSCLFTWAMQSEDICHQGTVAEPQQPTCEVRTNSFCKFLALWCAVWLH